MNTISKVGVIGAGTMGNGIAQACAVSGVDVVMVDIAEAAVQRGIAALTGSLDRLQKKERITAADKDAALKRIHGTTSYDALKSCDLVIEAATENEDIKVKILRQVDALMPPAAILATNTSPISITRLAAVTARPGKFIGMHFFNPVPMMALVELIRGLATEDATVAAVEALAKKLGKTPIVVKNSPGFVVNRILCPMINEAVLALQEGLASAEEIDNGMKLGCSHPIGPLALADMVGLDVMLAVMEVFYRDFNDPKYRPALLLKEMVAAGHLGRKSGRGFYGHAGGKQEEVPEPPAPTARPASVWVSPVELGAKLTELLRKLGAHIDRGARPAAQSLCLVAPLGHDATTIAIEEELDPARTVAVDCLFGTDRRRTLMTTPVTTSAMCAAAQGLLSSDGVPVTVIRDSPGFVTQRVIAQIVNIACDIAQQRIASPADIDTAVALGLGYPQGPLAWGDAIGASRILAVLEALLSFYGDPRYRSSPWLKRRALLGVSLLTMET